ncbi:single-stranded DNA-binding protein [Chryseobacterium indologenes]|uniref:single-stranded DNA-binding protein n=1 Tax=Chryseobacterium indologenes TaxID=253 RepID=UPI000B51AD85|nr:single-stranded DNA-binding protein [Chryseobacterium indologenes]ASE62101.1 single-stranded DNA-binding protein [Chryseobacterium indologenes]
MNITAKITRNAVVRTTNSGKEVVNFGVAIRHTFRNKSGEKISQPTFFDCAYWRTPNVAPYLTKGTVVELSGRITPSAWMDKEGKLRAGLNFHVSEIIFHGGDGKKDGQTAQEEPVKTGKSEPAFAGDGDDDLPF